jgi:hypothetical protein
VIVMPPDLDNERRTDSAHAEGIAIRHNRAQLLSL